MNGIRVITLRKGAASTGGEIVSVDTDASRPVTIVWTAPPLLENARVVSVGGVVSPPPTSGGGASGPIDGLRGTRVASSHMSGHRLVVPTSTGSIEYADNTIPSHRPRPMWMTLGAALSGDTVSVAFGGVVVEPSWAWTPGPLYLGVNGLPGQSVPSSGFVVQIGYATSPTSIYLDRSSAIVLAA